MTSEIVERVLRSSRYRDVDPALLARLAAEELPNARNADDAVKRVKRRLHQVVGAFRGRMMPMAAGASDLTDPGLRKACVDAMGSHASTRERLPHLGAFYPGIWAITGTPNRLLDLGCGLNPLSLPWMEIEHAMYVACDVDRRPLEVVRQFLHGVGQPHRVEARDLVAAPPDDHADVALMLKLVTTLDRQQPAAAARLIQALRARHVVVSFPIRSLGGRGTGMERTYRGRLDRLVQESGRVSAVAEASIPNELVFVLTLDG